MKPRTLAACTLALLSFLQPSCRKAKPLPQEWYRHISAHTSGTISRKSPVRVWFVNNVGTEGRDPEALRGLLSFDPPLTGRTEWASPRELCFHPERGLQPGMTYRATLQVGRLLDLPRAYARFEFSFTATLPGMEIDLEGLAPLDEATPNRFTLSGTLTTSDREEAGAVAKLLGAAQEGKDLAVSWTHDGDGLRHRFVARGIERREQPSAVTLRWTGAPIGARAEGERTVAVPSLGQFELIDAAAVLEPSRHVLLRFSDPLRKGQSLDGLVRVSGHELTFDVDNNLIRVYSARGFDGTVTVQVDGGIRNFNDRRLGTRSDRPLTFARIAPQVRFVGDGVILPQKDKLTVPFEAVNLRAVQVTAFQVYSGNMSQFFQQNNLQGSEKLSQVGRFLWRKTVALGASAGELSDWRRYSLDVTRLLQDNPGSLFRLSLSFNAGDSAFPCGEEVAVVPEAEFRDQDDASGEEFSSWDSAEAYYDERWDENWSNRDNPCHPAYYNPRFNKAVVQSRNFIASNIGLVAKMDESHRLHVVTTDIRSGEPLSGVTVRACNFQNQPLAEGESDGSGFLTLRPALRPFTLEARRGSERGYLRLSRDGALATSHFDVGGEKVNRGIKGVIYGERGVWRPGDTLHLTFVLFDRDRVLPPEHPLRLELFNPRGQLMQTRRPTRSLDAFHAFRVDTDENAPTGTWKAVVRVGGLHFEQPLRIETVVPNRLKIELKTRGEKLVRDVADEATVHSQWLHGATASNLRCEVKVRFTPRPTRFPRYSEYSFDDPAREITSSELALFDGRLDDQGDARFPVTLGLDDAAPGMMDATFTTRVFEESGDFSADQLALPFHPYTSYVGIATPKGDASRGMLLTDQDHVVRIVTIDKDGRPVSRDKLEVRLYKISWKWWWDRSGESLAQFASSAYASFLQEGTVSTRDGEGQWTFRIKYPEWGRYLIRVLDPQGGHACGKTLYVDWPGWAGRAREEKGAGATRLNFSADKERYRVGEKAVIFLPAAPQGRALVSLENGSSVLRQMWVSTRAGENRFEIELGPEMTPNVYVHVTLLQPHSGRASDTPIRLYGVIPLQIENPLTRLEPLLKMADELPPMQDFSVSVREKEGRPMTYTLAVVDEGLLGLTRYATPDLRRQFYNREALGVLTWDLFDEVAEAYGGELSRLLALGGDEAGAEAGGDRKPRRFPPVALFAGPFALAAGQSATHALHMPQYVGAVRVMVVAGRDGAFGSCDRSVPVRQDLMILPTLPRVIRSGETFDLPVAVFSAHRDVRQVQVTLDTNDRFLGAGPASRSVSFSRPGDQIVSFRLTAVSGTGQGAVRLRAVSGSRRAESQVFLPVLAVNPRTVRAHTVEVKPGETRSLPVRPFGVEGSNQVLVEVSALPSFQLEKRLQFLVQYPHGCLEQTLSTAFPQLYLKQLVRLTTEQQRDVGRHVEAAIARMRGFQNSAGGFSYWPGGWEAHDWTSTYAGYFLLEAARFGYRVPDDMLDRWKKSQRAAANAWVEGQADSRLNQAFRLFSLALAHTPDLGAMNRLREHPQVADTAAVLLAGAFQLCGQNDAAEDLLNRWRGQVAAYRDDRRTFGSALRDQALMVRVLAHMKRADRARRLLDGIVAGMGSDEWYSTQETAFALMAISSIYGGTPAAPLRFRLAWENEPPREGILDALIARQHYPAVPARERTLRITNPTSGPLFVTAYASGIAPAGQEKAAERNLRLLVEAVDRDGQPLDTSRLAQGSDLRLRVSVTNLSRRDASNLALTHMVAAGCQIANPRLFDEDPGRGYYDYQDVRDDRVCTYFSLPAGARKTFTVALNASYSGRFYMPGVIVEAMYDPSLYAGSVGKWVEIVR